MNREPKDKEILAEEVERLEEWIEGLYGHGQISKRLYDLIMSGQWPREQGD